MGEEQLLQYAIETSPARVELELTERCNLACKFCYNSQLPIDSMSIMEILKRLEIEEVPEIVLTGGEPLLHPQFKEIISSCKSIFQKTMVQTNGTLIDDEIADLFATHKVFEVNVSLHGSQKLHDKITGRVGSHKIAVEAVKKLISRNIRISSNFVMTKENIGGLKNNLTELYDLGVRLMTLTRFTPTGVGSSSSHIALSKQDMVSAIETADNFSKQHNIKILIANAIPLCSLPNSIASYCEYCHFGASRFYIDGRGNVLLCGMSRVRLGNILESSFKDIKRHSKEFAMHILGKDVPQKCAICADFFRCRGGCRAAALAVSGDMYGEDPYLTNRSIL